MIATMTKRPTLGFTLIEIMIVVVMIGLLAALALPAFQRITASSQNKAVVNNLRQLSGAAEQYYMENGQTTVASSELVGTHSTQYIKHINTIARENYSNQLTLGQPVTATNLAGARTITYLN